VNEQLGTEYNNYQVMSNSIDKLKFYELKENYRLSGIKQNMGTVAGARETLELLKEKDYFIILITARPYKKYFRIYSDTLNWLKKNNLKFDALIWQEEKEKYIIEHFNRDQALFCIDDNVSNIEKLAKNGFKTFYMPNKLMYDKPSSVSKIIDNMPNKNITIIENHKKLIKIIKEKY